MKNTDIDQKLRKIGQTSSKMGIFAKCYPKVDQYRWFNENSCSIGEISIEIINIFRN